MTDGIHPDAAHHLPPFITPPGDSDTLLILMGIFLLAIILGIGLFYFKLHAIPEHMSHRANKIQFEIVAVLSLLALFTHNHLYWIAALMLAMVTVPDFSTPLNAIADSLKSLVADKNAASEGMAKADDSVPEAGANTVKEA